MKNIEDLITLSKEYDVAFDRRNERLKKWAEEIFPVVNIVVEKTCKSLVESVTFYKSNLYVKSNINEPLHGVVLFAGFQRVANDEDIEKGFQIVFAPIQNGKIVVRVFDGQ